MPPHGDAEPCGAAEHVGKGACVPVGVVVRVEVRGRQAHQPLEAPELLRHRRAGLAGRRAVELEMEPHAELTTGA